jgi:hypothetical protein
MVVCVLVVAATPWRAALAPIAAAALMAGGMAGFFAPMVLQRRLRGTLEVLDIFKAAPLQGSQVALGQLLTPAVLTALAQWTALLLVALCALFGGNTGLGHGPGLWAALAAAALLGPLLSVVMMCVPFAWVLWFPAWAESMASAGGGFEAAGQRLIFAFAYFVLSALALAPALLLGGGVWWLLDSLLGQAGALLLGMLLAAGVLVAELRLLVRTLRLEDRWLRPVDGVALSHAPRRAFGKVRAKYGVTGPRVSRLGKLILVLFLALPLAAVGFVAGMRYVKPEPALRLALQRMQAPTPPVRGRDASDAVWLLEYDLPAGRDSEAAAAAQLRSYEARRAEEGEVAAAADPRKAWTRFPVQPADMGGCGGRRLGCLGYVQDNRALVAATLAEHQPGLAKALAFAQHDGLRIGVLPSLSSELPELGARRRLVMAYFAHRFVTGEPLGAIEELCRDLGGWRRIGGDSDNLVVSMVGAHFVRQDLMLMSEMLAKLPRETELPGECDGALQASSDYEFDLCPAMRNEFQMVRRAPDLMDGRREGWLRPSWQLDRRNFDALVAGNYDRFCGSRLLAAARADEKSGPMIAPAPRCARLRRLADPVGCTLAEVAVTDGFDTYLDRRTDQAAMLALMRTIVWLRDNANSPDEVEAALAHRPDELGLRRVPRYDREHDRLTITLLDPSREHELSLVAGAEPRPVKRRHKPSARRPPARALALQ